MTTETGTGTGTPKRGKGALQIVALLAILYAAASIHMALAGLLFVCALHHDIPRPERLRRHERRARRRVIRQHDLRRACRDDRMKEGQLC